VVEGDWAAALGTGIGRHNIWVRIVHHCILRCISQARLDVRSLGGVQVRVAAGREPLRGLNIEMP
jgi:hypothetical protein